MFSPLHNHIVKRRSFDAFDETTMFETVHNEDASRDQLRKICHYLLRILFPQTYARWRMDNGYRLPDAVNVATNEQVEM